MKLDIYVNYKKQCRNAFSFYEQHLDGKIISMTTFGEMNVPLPPGADRDDVIHARIEIGGSILMGADVPTAEPMRSAYLTLSFKQADEAEKVYALLADGGEVFMPIKQTDFAERFAMLRDRFGTSWMLLCQQ